jgi:uncharacterized repeat protein (TIGR04076 family)
MYKVKCKLIKFEADEKTFPCHFNYQIGEEIIYDGVRFTGRICPHLITPMMPVVYGVHLLGHKYSENVPFRYRGRDARDPEMAKYDGSGFRPLKEDSHSSDDHDALMPFASETQKARGAHFFCGDIRTLAHFSCTPVDLSDSEYCIPFYRRAIAILEKIEAEPDISAQEILTQFTAFEKNNIVPPLTPVFVEVLLEALSDMNYIVIQEGKSRATGKEPPSRPKIG